MDSTPILGYWNIRGLAHPIRMLLVYCGVDFEDRRYQLGNAPNYDQSEWLNVKESLGFDFPNLPYYIDKDHKIVQTNAILRYIATKYDLIGKTSQEQVNTLSMQDVVMDFRNVSVRVFYCNQDFEQVKSKHIEVYLPQILSRFENSYQNKWICGDNLTFVDFSFYEILHHNYLLSPSCLNKFPKLQRFLKQFESLERVKDYLLSDSTIKTPINNLSASFGSKVIS